MGILKQLLLKLKDYYLKNKKNINRAFIIGFVIAVVIVAYNNHQANPLIQAGKTGEKATMQVLIQIGNLRGCTSGCLERGDVVMTADADKEWSIAEKEGFLIIKMDLTPAQDQLLVKPLEKDLGKDERGRPKTEQLKRRQYAIDLSKIGIAPDDEKGRVINKTFGWDVVYEKK